MPIFVTGGTGFLGVNLVRLLVSRGHRVRLLVRPNASRLGLDSELIEFVGGDVTDARSVREAMRGCDQVYHVAAWVQISPWGLEKARRVNVEGTRNVCLAALELGVGRVVHTSSIATMAAGTLDEPATEETPWNLAHLSIPYYQTKRAAEEVVRQFVDRGLDAVIVNPTYLMGPWDIKPSAGRLLIQTVMRRLRACPRRGGINFVDVQKAAAGHLLAMERGRTGQRYILGGENLSYRSFLERVTTLVGVSAPPLILPFAAAGSLAGRWFPQLFRDVNLCVLRSGFLEHYVSSDKAKTELGFDVTGIDQAMEEAMAWLVEHGYVKLPSPSFLGASPAQSRY